MMMVTTTTMMMWMCHHRMRTRTERIYVTRPLERVKLASQTLHVHPFRQSAVLLSYS